MRIIRTKADGKQPSAFKNCVAEDKDKRFSETKEIIAGKQQSNVRNQVKHVVTPKSSFLCKMYRKKPKTSQKWLVFGCFLVEAAGLEPTVSSTRNWRDTTFATPRNVKKLLNFVVVSYVVKATFLGNLRRVKSAKNLGKSRGFGIREDARLNKRPQAPETGAPSTGPHTDL